LYAYGFRFYFTPLPGCFSPFPHGTTSLSVINSYLALEGGPPGFRQGFTCPALLRNRIRVLQVSPTGLLPTADTLSIVFGYHSHSTLSVLQPHTNVWFGLYPLRSPLLRVSHVDFFSSGYLDVSVLRVRFSKPMYSVRKYLILSQVGCPIRKSTGQKLFASHRSLSQLITSFIAG
jgi:hypothetical protein